jgi:hypothetical protein
MRCWRIAPPPPILFGAPHKGGSPGRHITDRQVKLFVDFRTAHAQRLAFHTRLMRTETAPKTNGEVDRHGAIAHRVAESWLSVRSRPPFRAFYPFLAGGLIACPPLSWAFL